MLRLKAELLHELDVEYLPFKEFGWDQWQRAFLVAFDLACFGTRLVPVAGVMPGSTAICAASTEVPPIV
jgi:hypothetical protein